MPSVPTMYATMPGMAPAIPLRQSASIHTNGSMAMCCSGSQTVPSCPYDCQRMTVIHDTARDVDMRYGVAVEQ